VLVTGGSGFVGSHLLRALVADPTIEAVHVLDLLKPQLESPKIRWVSTDLRQPIRFVPPAPIDACFHLAAICREPGYDWDEYFDGNHSATRRLCEWATRVGVDNLIFTSTAMVFRAEDVRHVESDAPNPDTAYGISKALAEEALLGWQSAASGRRLRIVRPGVVFGKGAAGNFVNLQRALRRNLFVYVGRKTTVKSAIYVKDLVALLRYLEDDELQQVIYHGTFIEPNRIGEVCAAFLDVYGMKRLIPTLPFKLALLAALPFQLLNAIGIRNPVNTRRIEKLYYSTDIASPAMLASDFRLRYDLRAALRDWRADCAPRDIF
jgi:nucleoside-diphosphate-sugar epimerase